MGTHFHTSLVKFKSLTRSIFTLIILPPVASAADRPKGCTAAASAGCRVSIFLAAEPPRPLLETSAAVHKCILFSLGVFFNHHSANFFSTFFVTSCDSQFSSPTFYSMAVNTDVDDLTVTFTTTFMIKGQKFDRQQITIRDSGGSFTSTPSHSSHQGHL